MPRISHLLADFERFRSLPAQRRGYKLEDLLEQAFRQAHFRVIRNAGIASPRQTDLVARYGDTRYLIEAKWEKSPADINVLDTVRSRMGRAASSTVIGVIVSVSGFTETVVDDVRQRRDLGPVLLLGEEELTQALKTPTSLAPLLRLKQEELTTHGRVHLAASPTLSRRSRPFTDLPSSELRLLDIDLKPLPHIRSGGGQAGFVFAQELPDVDWDAGHGSGVALDLPVKLLDEQGIADLLYEFHSMGWSGSEPRWNIQQIRTTWQGIGAREFVDTLSSWKERFEGLEHVHHTEQATYFDTCPGGGFYTITVFISSDASRTTHHCDVSFLLPGIPVDLRPIQHLAEEFDTTAVSYFRPLARRSVTRRRLEVSVPLEVVGYIVSQNDPFPPLPGEQARLPTDWVTGIVVKNPHRAGNGAAAPEDWPQQTDDGEFLVCDLRSHHQLTDLKGAYFLHSWEYAYTSNAAAFKPVADW
ncbi:restriction endonuclease [Streptomyces sp. NBC_00996]|uniref:restriction endonuclease n=1 Tax=Streptomyces sp. NBC_00996 TaxID=2903710 RepID=UPI003866EF4C|nr:restriction endonuclease [Streptomyces sp. NBC_00996]